MTNGMELTDREVAALRWLRDHLASRPDVTISSVAKELPGVDNTRLGKCLKLLDGKGHRRFLTDEVVAAIEVYRRAMTAGHGLSGGFVETRVATTVFALANRAWEGDAMCLLEAPAGCGKTRAAEALARRYPGAVLTVYARPQATPMMLLKDLCRRAGLGLEKSYSREAMEDALLAGLPKRSLVVIDQFHDLSGRAVHELMFLHDNIGMPVLLLATHQGAANLLNTWNDRFHQFKRRIRFRVMLGAVGDETRQETFSRADIAALAGTVAGGAGEDALEWLYAAANEQGDCTVALTSLERAIEVEGEIGRVTATSLGAARASLGRG